MSARESLYTYRPKAKSIHGQKNGPAVDLGCGFTIRVKQREISLGIVHIKGCAMPSDLRPISEFDPSRPAMVHDQLNDMTFHWRPEEYRDHYERYARDHAPGIVEWDGLLLDGWWPLPRP